MPLGFHPIEILILLVAVLLIFAPKKLPQITAGLGKSIRDFKRELTAHKEKEPEPKEIEQ